MTLHPESSACFRAWYDDADMPFETEDGWVDLETGISFEHSLRVPSTAERRAEKLAEMTAKHGAAIAAAQAQAKEAGWAALTGTSPQKAWAAQIRAKLIPLLMPSAEGLGARITTAKFWIENRDLDLHKLNALILSMRADLEEAAAVRKLAAAKAKVTKMRRNTIAAKVAERDAIILELLDSAAVIPAVPHVLGEKIIDQDGLRVFVDSVTKLVTFLIKSVDGKEVRQATLDAVREARTIAAMS